MPDLNLVVSQTLNITTRYKNTLVLSAIVTTDNDVPYNFIGCDVVFEIYKVITDIKPLYTINTKNGLTLITGEIDFNASLPETLKPGTYYYRLTITTANKIVVTWLSGQFIIK